MEEIHLTGIRKSYGKEVAVRHLDLTVEPGAFLTILGPSGCGKTTTLRVIAGLEEPEAGEIRFGDRLIFSRQKGVIVPPESRNLGLIFQSYALWPHMTVERNITLGLNQMRLSAGETAERLEAALEKVQMKPYQLRYPSELSGGQQQRVALARMIASRSSILLMDEPLSNLDAKLRVEMRSEILRLQRALAATTIYVTHDQTEAMTMGDRVMVLDQGVVQQVAQPDELYRRPANEFVARFIGAPTMNLLRGMCRGGVAHVGDHTLRAGNRQLANPDGAIHVGVRPEHLRIVAETDRSCILTGRVAVVENLGKEAQVHIDIDAALAVTGESSLIATVEPHSVPEERGTVGISFDAEAAHFFEAASGTVIQSNG